MTSTVVVLVLYSIDLDSSHLVEGSFQNLPNALELHLPTNFEDDHLTVGFIISQCPHIFPNHNSSFCFFTEINGRYVHLPAPTSIIPWTKRNVINLKLVKSATTPYVPQNQLDYFGNISMEISKKSEADHMNKYSTWNEKRSIGSVNDKNLQSFVGEDTAAAIAEATEVAKGVATAAAKSLFSFAQNMGKSMLDAAGNVGMTGGSTGCTLTIGAVVSMSKMKVTVTKLLSTGGFGIVYVVTDEVADKSYALKQLLCQSKEQIVEGHNEIDVLLELKGHPNIIQLFDYSSTQLTNSSSSASIRQILLVFPLYPRGTAWDIMEKASNMSQWPFSEQKATYIILKVADALQFMHDRGFSHRDVKPHNILLEDNLESIFKVEPILTDFGSVAHARMRLQTRQECLLLEDEAARKTSAAYRAPELYMPPFPPCEIDERVDTWALGCTTYALAFGRSPFDSAKEGVSKLAIMNNKYTIPNNGKNRDCQFSNKFLKMISDMLQTDPTKRPYMHEIIERYTTLNK